MPFYTIGHSNRTLSVKVFDSAERARREMDKLVAERLRKGYVEEGVVRQALPVAVRRGV
ncbi:WGR domain-containing protein [Cupriavidus necator]